MIQEIFNSINYGFEWTGEGASRWYSWDEVAAEAKAKAERDALAKELKAKGYSVKKFSSGKNLMSRGGIGSGNPHIEVYAKSFGLNAWK